MFELLLPVSCAGCGVAGVRVCDECKAQWTGLPQRITTRADPHAPIWSLGPYGGSRRRALIALKERGRRDVARPMGAAIGAAVRFLIACGELDEDILLVPAPTSRASARKRGGDPVMRMILNTGFDVWKAVEHTRGVKDSVGLDVQGRRKNLAGHVRFTGATTMPSPERGVLVVDDVITTGATMAVTLAVLTSAGVKVRGGLGWSNA
ncbi:ComF family protein [Corynebacterium sp. ZY180755]